MSQRQNQSEKDAPPVIILAAGVGARLMPLTRNTPKSLLDLGGGYTLLETQLQAIEEAGGRNVIIVVGYRAEQIEAKIANYHGSLSIRTVYNPFYRMANNIVSAWMGLKECSGAAVLLNGDDTFTPQIMRSLFASAVDITMVVSRKDAYDDDDMKVITSDHAVLDVGKDIAVDRAGGESIGMMLFRGCGLTAMRGELDRLVRKEENLQTFYLQALRNLMKLGHTVSFVECDSDAWCEVDFHPDLEEMRTRVQKRFKVVDGAAVR